MAGGKIFICYRRDDSAGDAGRLFDRLEQRFPGRVFMDVSGIALATRWADVIERTLRDCEVVVVLIGKRWLEPGADGLRRIDVADDPTRREIVTAIRLGLKIVPLAVSGAAVPDRKHLPPEIAAITDWQAHRVDHEDFDHDASRLVRALEGVLGERVEVPGGPLPLHGGRPEAPRGLEAHAPREKVGWFNLTFGSFKVWISVGVATMAVLVIGMGTMLEEMGVDAGDGPGIELPGDTTPGVTTPAPAPNTPTGTTAPPAPSPQPPSAPTLAGSYALQAYAVGGTMVPAMGTMQLLDAGGGAYRFQTHVTVPSLGASFFYDGLLQQQGALWTTTTANTNDPSAVFTPIPTEVAVDGPVLRMQNAYGQAAAWRRQ